MTIVAERWNFSACFHQEELKGKKTDSIAANMFYTYLNQIPAIVHHILDNGWEPSRSMQLIGNVNTP